MRRSARHRLGDFAESLWVYLVLSGLLTFVMAGFSGLRDATRLSTLFVGNLALSVAIGASLTLALGVTSASPVAEKLPAALRALIGCLVFVLAVLGGVEVGLQALAFFVPTMREWFPRTAVWIVALPVSVTMFFVGRLKERADLERMQKREAEAQREEAKLAALLARTHPHFLFNSLNSIVALIEDDPKAAERALIQLAALFRYVLEGASASKVRLGDELGFVRDYVALEALRFGERLKVALEVDEALGDLRILPLLVQPLVENAIRHGVASRPEGGCVRLRASLVGEVVRIDVDDDGPGPSASSHRGTGTSQRDLLARLQIAYAGRARLTTSRSELGGFRARLELPREGP